MTELSLCNCFVVTQIGLKEQYVSQRTNQNFAGRNLSISFESGSLQYFLAKKLIDAFLFVSFPSESTRVEGTMRYWIEPLRSLLYALETLQ